MWTGEGPRGAGSPEAVGEEAAGEAADEADEADEQGAEVQA